MKNSQMNGAERFIVKYYSPSTQLVIKLIEIEEKGDIQWITIKTLSLAAACSATS